MAVNSPCAISNDRLRSTSTEPKARPTFSSRINLSLIAPPNAWNTCQLHEQAVQNDPDDADDNHPDNHHIRQETGAGIPDQKAQPIAPSHHLRRYHDHPGETRRHPQRRDDLRENSREDHSPKALYTS